MLISSGLLDTQPDLLVQINTCVLKPMSFHTGSGSLLRTGCWGLRGKATICIL